MPYLEDGIVSPDEITLPDEERRKKGPYAVIECIQRIPCDPCVSACPFKAITIEGSINEIPEINYDLCTGCGVCVGLCPGLAIFIIDESREGDEAILGMPYEFTPLPEVGEEVILIDRGGKEAGRGTVERVKKDKKTKTPVVYVTIPREKIMEVRFIKGEKEK
jgi:Fe-S-cluster-containing hydrogenase component 2